MDSKHKIMALVLSILIIFFVYVLSRKDVTTILICQKESNIVLSNNIEKYTFKGTNDVINSEDLEVNIYSDNQDLIDNYYDIVSGNKECYKVDLGDKYIMYKCHYDIESTDFYKELKNKDGKLLFKDVKEVFEEDNFDCNYK